MKNFTVKEICIRDPFRAMFGADIDISNGCLYHNAIATLFYAAKKKTMAINFFYQLENEQCWRNHFVFFDIISFEYFQDKDTLEKTPKEVLEHINEYMLHFGKEFKEAAIELKTRFLSINELLNQIVV